MLFDERGQSKVEEDGRVSMPGLQARGVEDGDGPGGPDGEPRASARLGFHADSGRRWVHPVGASGNDALWRRVTVSFMWGNFGEGI